MKPAVLIAPLFFALCAMLAGCNEAYRAEPVAQGEFIPSSAPSSPPPVPGRNPFKGRALSSPQPAVSISVEDAAAASSASPPASIPESAAVPAGGTYRVAAGDTVHGLSRRFNVPIRAIIERNDLEPPYLLRVGQSLAIPTQRVHVVEAGQTVYGISRIYGVDLSELMKLNDIGAPYRIRVGQRLLLPSAGGVRQAAAAPSAPPAGVEPQAQTPSASANAPSPPPPPPSSNAAIPAPPPRSEGKFLWPVGGRVISSFGPKAGGLHNDGINIEAPAGSPVIAAENGVVAYAGNELKGFGNLLLLKHADGWVTAYAHNEELLVPRGAQVKRGDIIAKVGQSGNVTSPQLHFEVRKGSRAIDPREMLGPQRASN